MIIDISKWQTTIEWAKVKADGVYIKATEGVGYIDPMFKSHVAGANFAKIPIGFYHFASLNSASVLIDSAAEAKAFYEATKGIAVGLPYALDIERNDLKLSPADVLKWIQNFVLTLHLYHINDVVLYSYTPFLNANLPKNHQLSLTLPLWIAAYTERLILPTGWKNAWLWQYTSKGVVAGITGNVDLNKKL